MKSALTLNQLAEYAGAKLVGDPQCVIQGVAPLASAKTGDLTFLIGGRYHQYLPNTKASAVVLTQNNLSQCPCHAIVTDNPELAFAKILHFFEKKPEKKSGIHPNAIIGAGCEIDPSVVIEAGCILGDGVCIGKGSIISAGTIIGDGVVIGEGCCLYPRVTIYQGVSIGDRVILHSGVVVGADGFGLTNDKGRWVKIPQVGSVIIGNDVEVGANTTIDRGALEDTVIEEGVKLDDLVMIAHNVHVGAHTVMAGCAGIAGSTRVGKHCVIGGGVCITGHITITDHVVITGMGMVTGSIQAPGVYSSGTGLQTNLEWRKSAARFKQLEKIVRRIKNLEKNNE